MRSLGGVDVLDSSGEVTGEDSFESFGKLPEIKINIIVGRKIIKKINTKAKTKTNKTDNDTSREDDHNSEKTITMQSNILCSLICLQTLEKS